MFKNMKIEINDEQPLDEIESELRRLGYFCVAFYDEENLIGVNVKNKIATSFTLEETLPDSHWKLTTLTELKQMEG